MLKKIFKECPYLTLTLWLLNLVGIVIIFLGAFTNIPVLAKCFLLIMGIACLVGSVSALVILMYEFEKLEMLLKDIKRDASKTKEVKFYLDWKEISFEELSKLPTIFTDREECTMTIMELNYVGEDAVYLYYKTEDIPAVESYNKEN